ncbi:hypothetical protein N7U66_03575 [Lacinutrix neustonica]|uniref:Uncharacterized protein n=1 Tax=Lacinutrix neustonica TaxID=2980107 RepID=A0A9E8MXD9_9FLAO|nr:hypothetical protein [Lacinutrix neustonica]WAC02761.1 hypothetical protein N7U66_03575 [Lacinutrix neustonica]
METGMIVISTLLITLCALPFILVYGSTKKKEILLKMGLEALIKKDNGHLTDYVVSYPFALGFDRTTKHIYFYKKNQEEVLFQKVKLNEVKACEVQKEKKHIKNGKQNNEIVQSVALVFTYTKGNTVEQFKLYDFDDSSQPNGEMDLAVAWKQKIEVLLSENVSALVESKTENRPPELA